MALDLINRVYCPIVYDSDDRMHVSSADLLQGKVGSCVARSSLS